MFSYFSKINSWGFKGKVLLLIFLFSPFAYLAQKSSIDSLLRVLKTAPTDTVKIQLLNKLVDKYLFLNEYEIALNYVNEAEQMCESIRYERGYVYTLNNKANIYFYQGQYDMAEEIILRAIKKGELIGDKHALSKSFSIIGNIYQSAGKYSKAMEASLKALRLYEEIGNKTGIATSYNGIANVFYKQKNYQKSIENYLNSLKIQQEIGNKVGEGIAYNNIGNVYIEQSKIDTALKYYLFALEIRKKIGDRKAIASTNNKLGIVYSKLGRHDKALEKLLESLNTNLDLGYKQGVSQDYYLIGLEYMQTGDFTQSDIYLSKSMELAKEMNDLNRLAYIYGVYTQMNEKKNDYKQAYNYLKLYTAINDSLFGEEYNKQIAEMNTKYETEKKDKELMKLDNEIKEQQTEKKSLQILAFSGIFATIILLLFLFFLRITNKKINSVNETLNKRNLEIEQKKDEINQQAVKIARYQSQMNPHFIFNAINGLQSMVLKEDKIGAVHQIQSLSRLLRITLNNSEREYISIEEEKNYLSKYVEFELQRFIKKFKFTFEVDKEIPPTALMPTMIIQPFVENAIKHAGLNEIENAEIKIFVKKNTDFPEHLFTITVEDNGTGIRKQEIKNRIKEHESKGLKITRSRLLLELKKCKIEINDYLNISSPALKPDSNFGTRITIVTPYYLEIKDNVNDLHNS